jgi:hypothetical protein
LRYWLLIIRRTHIVLKTQQIASDEIPGLTRTSAFITALHLPDASRLRASNKQSAFHFTRVECRFPDWPKNYNNTASELNSLLKFHHRTLKSHLFQRATYRSASTYSYRSFYRFWYRATFFAILSSARHLASRSRPSLFRWFRALISAPMPLITGRPYSIISSHQAGHESDFDALILFHLSLIRLALLLIRNKPRTRLHEQLAPRRHKDIIARHYESIYY